MIAFMLFSLCYLDTIIIIVIVIIYYYWDYSATSYSAPQSVLATLIAQHFLPTEVDQIINNVRLRPERVVTRGDIGVGGREVWGHVRSFERPSFAAPRE